MSIFERLSALSDVRRVRILKVLEREELGVGELVSVLVLPQSTVSRHLKVLLKGGWLQKRSMGTTHLYRCLGDAMSPEARALWEVVASEVDVSEDLRRLEQVVALRQVDAREFFGRHGGSWDTVKRDLYGEAYLLPMVSAMLPDDMVVADLGCGTGAVVRTLAESVRKVFAVDREAQMVRATRERSAGLSNVVVQQADLDALPLSDAAVDYALCILVLHYVSDVTAALTEAARILRPGGRLVIVDMVAHEREEYRRTMGHEHLGFDEESLRNMAYNAGYSSVSWEELPRPEGVLGPGLFLAVFGR